ncbi:MFS transporter [Gallaecimonas xiamenensis]|uniref:MFS transporter n=1 Tax=Gallaecimonas xiamenensis 3-C-1 TaxID=745411 RepID=K2IZB9_9GAMM|nr:MFS transporter [Gallaecimonas xiamenensis]EKE67907.1 hypothetical protein B3C1_17737 [Gallaecimonas xiamenensis 3-C-1]
MNKPLSLVLLASLALLPQGLTGQLYSAGAHHMAGALGLSQDEARWFNIAYLLATLCGLPLASWLLHARGSRLTLQLGALIGLASTLISTLAEDPAWHFLAWGGHGLAAGLLTVAAQTLVLRHFGFSAIALVEGLLMTVVTLLPMGLYPWLLATLASQGLWQLVFAVQLLPYGALLCWPLFFGWPESSRTRPLPFNGPQALLTWAFTLGLGLLLLRGEHHNWLDSPFMQELLLWTLVGGQLLLFVIFRQRRQGRFQRFGVLANRHAKVYMFDAALAGFAILGTTLLIGIFSATVLQYSEEELGRLHLVGLGGMGLGLLFSLAVTRNPRMDPIKVVPLGVALVLLSSYWLSGSEAGSGLADLWPALLIRGVAIGILNVTLTIHILRGFARRHIPDGVAFFYQFRTLGSLLAGALFGHLMQRESLQAGQVLGQSAQLHDALAQGSYGAPALLGQLQHQALAVGAMNNFRWFILAVLVLVPLMKVLLHWAKGERH